MARRSEQRPAGATRVTVVFLQWDPVASPPAFAALDARLRRLGVPARRLIVDNAADNTVAVTRADGVTVISGDNTTREFSGWQHGIAHARAGGEPTDVWLLVNDRFATSPYSFLDRLGPGAIRAAHSLQAVVGRLDYYPCPVTSFGMTFSSWVNTAFYLVPEGVLQRVGSPVLVDRSNLHEVLPPRYPGGSALFCPDGPVGELHGRYIASFLAHLSDAPHSIHWYRRLDLGEETWPEFRGKVMSILNEQLFSARSRVAGAPLLELELADRLGRLGADTPAVRDAATRVILDPEQELVRLTTLVGRARLALAVLASGRSKGWRRRRWASAPLKDL